MTAEFYLFDVGVGQAAALKLPNNKWCIFDVGKSSEFSPVNWIANRNRYASLIIATITNRPIPTFNFLKATISHHHADHLSDCRSLFQYGPQYLSTVDVDSEYIKDVISSNSKESLTDVIFFAKEAINSYGPITTQPDYGGVLINERRLPVVFARNIGGDSNARVNNASIITRINVYGNSILLCGDMEKEAWDTIISDTGTFGKSWRLFLSNIDIMIAPHHGHRSGFSTNLLNIAKPSVVLISIQSNNPNVDSRYSQEFIRGIKIGNDSYSYISTRQKGHIKIKFQSPTSFLEGKGSRSWSFGDEALK
jgi:beta-lactamase superfamily II metal-dependent hydrolase